MIKIKNIEKDGFIVLKDVNGHSYILEAGEEAEATLNSDNNFETITISKRNYKRAENPRGIFKLVVSSNER